MFFFVLSDGLSLDKFIGIGLFSVRKVQTTIFFLLSFFILFLKWILDVVICQLAHDARTTLYGRWNDVTTLKLRQNGDNNCHLDNCPMGNYHPDNCHPEKSSLFLKEKIFSGENLIDFADKFRSVTLFRNLVYNSRTLFLKEFYSLFFKLFGWQLSRWQLSGCQLSGWPFS